MASIIDKNFCAAVLAARERINKERAERDTCPTELGGCARKDALCTITKRGMQLGKFCPHCRWSSLFLDVAKGRTKVAAKGVRKRA